jgi:hypothetical protein
MLAGYATDLKEKERLLQIASEDPIDSVLLFFFSDVTFNLFNYDWDLFL